MNSIRITRELNVYFGNSKKKIGENRRDPWMTDMPETPDMHTNETKKKITPKTILKLRLFFVCYISKFFEFAIFENMPSTNKHQLKLDSDCVWIISRVHLLLAFTF